jgi:hypothetical protein
MGDRVASDVMMPVPTCGVVDRSGMVARSEEAFVVLNRPYRWPLIPRAETLVLLGTHFLANRRFFAKRRI